jgi:hypothetical protein
MPVLRDIEQTFPCPIFNELPRPDEDCYYPAPRFACGTEMRISPYRRGPYVGRYFVAVLEMDAANSELYRHPETFPSQREAFEFALSGKLYDVWFQWFLGQAGRFATVLGESCRTIEERGHKA